VNIIRFEPRNTRKSREVISENGSLFVSFVSFVDNFKGPQASKFMSLLNEVKDFYHETHEDHEKEKMTKAHNKIFVPLVSFVVKNGGIGA